MFLYLSWDDSIKTHPNNKPYDFIVDLPKTLRFLEKWEVALSDIKVKSSKKNSFYFVVDFCQESFLKGSQLPVLRRVDEKVSAFAVPYFLDITKNEIQSIRVSLVDQNLDFYQLSDIDCVLELREKNEST